MKPLDQLDRETRAHSVVCRCGECKELFWRLCTDRGGVPLEQTDLLCELFDLWRWSLAAELVRMFRSVRDFEIDVAEYGASVGVRLSLELPPEPIAASRRLQIMEDLAALTGVTIDRRGAREYGRCLRCRHVHLPEEACAVDA